MNTNRGSGPGDEAPQDENAQGLGLMLSPLAQLLTTILISIAIYYLSPLLPIWPEYTKRAVWETIVFLTPSRMVYAMDHLSARASNSTVNGAEVVRFQRSDFGNNVAKAEALRRLFHLDGNGPFIPSIGRARTFSGLGTFLNKGRSDMPAGLGNWDNSCYQNSVIQGLASLPPLQSFIDANLTLAGGSGEMPTHKALQAISARLNDENNNGKSIWTPPALKSMSSWQQQDAQEYFSKVMDEIEKEARRALEAHQRCRSLAEPLPASRAAVSATHTAGEPQKENIDSKLIRHVPASPVEGLIAQRVGCIKCGYCEGLSLIPFTFLTLPLGRSFLYDVRNRLDEFTAFETIEGVECSKCTVLAAKAQLERLIAHNESFLKPEADQQDPHTLSLVGAAQARLNDTNIALAENDFSDNTLSKKLKLSPKNRATTTKSRQAVVARPPRLLTLHINRSLFDETTGAQLKNTAAVRFPLNLDLSYWSLGHAPDNGPSDTEIWEIDPSKPMLPSEPRSLPSASLYELRAVITHQGRHENGHYVAYRKRPWRVAPNIVEQEDENIELESGKYEDRWFRFSDESVSQATEGQVLSQSGVFMLFYERLDTISSKQDHSETAQTAEFTTESSGHPLVNGGPALHEIAKEVASDLQDQEEVPVSNAEDHPHLKIGDVSAASSVVDDSSNFSQSEHASDDGNTSDISSIGRRNDLSRFAEIQQKHDAKDEVSASGYPSPPLSTH